MADPQQNQDPFGSYSPQDREDIANQLDALQKSGKLNPAQTQGVGRAMGYLRPPKAAPKPATPVSPTPQPSPGLLQQTLNAPGVGATLNVLDKVAVQPFETLSKTGAELGGKAYTAYADTASSIMRGRPQSPEERGANRAVGELIGSVIADPRQWPLLGTGKVASPLLKRGMDLGFSGLMGKGAADAATTAGQLWDDSTPEGREAKANALTHMIVGTGMAAHVGSGMTREAISAKPEEFTNKYSDRVKQAVKQPAPTPKPTPATPEDVAASVDQKSVNGLRGEDKITPTAKKASPPKPSTKVDTIAADNAELQKAGMPPTMKLKPSPTATPEATVSSGGTGALSSEEVARGLNGDKHYYVSPDGKITYQGSQPDAPPQTIARGGAVVRYNPRRGWDTVNGDSSLLPKFKRKLDTIQGSPSKVEPAERAGIAPATPSPTPMKAGDAVRSETAMDTYKSTQADIAQVDKDIASQTKARANALKGDQPRFDQEISALQQKKADLQGKLQSAFSEHAKGLSSKDALDLHENLTKELTKTQTAREQFDNLLKGDVQAKGLRSLLGQMIPRDARQAIHNMLGDVQLANVYDPKVLKFVNSASLKAEVKNTRMIMEEAMKDPDLDPKTRKMYENFMAPDKKGNPKAVVFRPKQVKGAITKDAAGNVAIPGNVPELTTAAGNWLLADGKKLNMTSAELRGRIGKMGTDAAARIQHLEMLKGTLERAHNIPDLQTRRVLVDLRNGTVDKTKLSDKQLKGILQRPDVGKALLGDKWEQARTELGRELLSRKPEAKPPVVQAPPVEAKTVEQPKLPSASYFPQEVMDNPAVKSANERLARMDKPTVQAAIKKVQQKIDLEGATKQTAIYRQALQQRLNELSGKGRQPDAQQVADMSAAKAANGTVAPKVEKPAPKPKKSPTPQTEDKYEQSLGKQFQRLGSDVKAELGKVFESAKLDWHRKKTSLRVKEVQVPEGRAIKLDPTFSDYSTRHLAVRKPDGTIESRYDGSYDSVLHSQTVAGGELRLKPGHTAYVLDNNGRYGQRVTIYRSVKGEMPVAPEIIPPSKAAAPPKAEPRSPIIDNIEAAAKMRDEQESSPAPIIDKVNQQARVNEIAGLLEKVPQRDRDPLKGMVNDIVPKGKDRYEGYKLALNAYHDAMGKPEPGVTPMTAARAAINKFFVDSDKPAYKNEIFKQMLSDAREGVVYHGTNLDAAQRIMREGFKPLRTGAVVKETLGKLGKTFKDLTPDQQEGITTALSSYKTQLDSFSVTPAGEVATRWAGKGGEIASQVIRSVTGNYPAKGDAAVVKARFTEQGKQSYAYKRLQRELDNIERALKEQSYPYTEEHAIQSLWNEYMDLRVKPEDVKAEGVLTDIEGLKKGPLKGSGGAGAAGPDLKQQLKDAGMKDADVNRAMDANPDDPKAAIKYLYRDRMANRIQAMQLVDHLKVVLPNDPDLMVQMKDIIGVAEKNGISQAEMIAINNELLNKPRTMAAAAGGNKPPDKPVVGKSMADIGKMFTPEPIEEAPTPNREALTPEARAAAQRVQELLQTSKLPDLGRSSILGSVQKLDLSRSAKVFRWERALKIYKEGLSQQDPMALRKALDSINDNTKMAFGLDPTDYLNVPQAQTVVPELDAVRAMRAAKVSAENPGMLARSMAFVRRMPDWAYRTFYEQFPDLKGAVTAAERETGQKINNNPYYTAERTANQILGTISSIGKRYGEITRDAYKAGLWDATSKVIELRSYNHALETLEDKVSTAENQIAAHSKAYDLLSDAMRDGRVSPKAGARKLANLGKKLRDAKATAKELSRSIDNGDVLPGGYTRDMVEDHLNLIEDQLGPDDWAKVNAYGDKLYAIHREHLVKLHEAGMVSDDAMATFLARGMDHAPQYRYLDAVAAEGRKNGGNLYTSDVDVLKPLLGSDKLTKDPVESMMKWDMRAANLIAKNNVAKSFSRFGEQFGLATRLKSRAEVPAGEVPIPVWETSQEAGEYQDEPDNESNTETAPPPPGGQRIYYSVPAEIADNLAAVNSRQLGALEKVLRYFKVPFQAGATTANLAFALPNALRHVMDYHILAPSGAGINPVEHAKFIGQWADSLMKVIKSDPSYVKDFLPSGAAFSTYQTAITPGAFLRDVASGASPKPTVKSIVMAPIHGTERLVNVLEEATKFTAFKRELAKSGSMEEAVHNTLNLGGAPNFRNMGTAGQMMNLLFPFSNAHLRYTGRVLEHIDPRTPEGQSHFIRLATAVTLSELALAHWNAQYKDDKGKPEYDHVPDQEKQQNWYMLLPTTYQTSDGFTRHNAVKVPKPTAIRLFSNTIGSVIDHGMGGRTSLEQIPADFVSQFMPGQYRLRADDLTGSFGRGIVASANPAIREPYEQAGNLDAWKNRPIVPKYMEGVEHPYDTNNTVHPSVEALAGRLGASPLRLQHGVRSELAGLGDQAMDVADKFFPDKPRGDEDILEGDEKLSRQPVIGAMVRRFRGTPFDQVAQDNEEKFYRMLGRAEQKQTTSGFLERQNHPDFASYYTKNVLPIEVSSAYKEAAQSISEYRGLQREVLKAKMAPAAKRTALKGINTAIQTIIETTNRAYSQYVQ